MKPIIMSETTINELLWYRTQLKSESPVNVTALHLCEDEIMRRGFNVGRSIIRRTFQIVEGYNAGDDSRGLHTSKDNEGIVDVSGMEGSTRNEYRNPADSDNQT